MCNCLDEPSDTTSGWAMSVSGKTGLTRWDERDNLQLQFSCGEGYSHYVNDPGAEFLMGSRTNQDGETGKAKQVQLSAKYRY